MEKSIEELEQSDLFKYSPYKELSSKQRELVKARRPASTYFIQELVIEK